MQVAPALPLPEPTVVQFAVPGLFTLPTPGSPTPLGASLTAEGVNFAVYAAAEATTVSLCVFTPEDLASGAGPTAEIPLDPALNRTGTTWHVHLPQCTDQLLYGYRVDGPKAAHEGHRFDPSVVLLDPYAHAAMAGDRVVYGEPSKTFGEKQGPCWPQYAGAVPSRADVFDWQGVQSPNRHLKDLCVYETHVRGLTAGGGEGTAGAGGKEGEGEGGGGGATPGTYAALIGQLPYLKRMGINALELMPCHEFNELEYYTPNPVTGEMRYNFWGYSTVNFFSPMQRYAAGAGADCGREAGREFKTMVRECHRAGIEVIMDVVFNHTAEGRAPRAPCPTPLLHAPLSQCST